MSYFAHGLQIAQALHHPRSTRIVETDVAHPPLVVRNLRRTLDPLDMDLHSERPMKRIRLVGGVLVLVVGVAGVACEGAAPPSPAAASSAQSSTSAKASPSAPADAAIDAPTAVALTQEDNQLALDVKTEHRHHHLGFAGFVMMAVDTLGTSSEQEMALNKIRGEFDKKLKPLGDANASVGIALADGIAAGTIDKTKVDMAVARAVAMVGDSHSNVDEELTELHDVLRLEQRFSLVDKVDAEWTLWKEANALDQAAESAKPDGHLGHVANDVGLTTDQVAKARAAIDAAKGAKESFDPAGDDAHMKAFATDFVGDKFDPRKAPRTAAENARLLSWGLERTVRFYEAIAPILTPNQRAQIADELREHAREAQPEGTP
jgi:Spy/CpxP family protein refolding chaperone